MRQIEKPEVSTKVVDKKTLWFNIRESRLMYMFHRILLLIVNMKQVLDIDVCVR